MLTTWKQADVFPIIAQVIRDEYAQEERFVTHDEITARLLAHPEAVHLIKQAHEQQDEQRSHEWLAHNMVALGLRINEDIDQRKVPGRRGYRLATASDCARLLLHGDSFAGEAFTSV